MSEIYTYISLPDYLAQWLACDFGGWPLRLPKGSMESKIVRTFMRRCPDGVLPDVAAPGMWAVELPYFEDKDPRYSNYLPEYAKRALVECIRSRFDIQLWQDLHKFGYIGRRKDLLIYAWLEQHGIDPTERNWSAVVKRYQRLRNFYLSGVRRDKQRNKRKSG